MKTPRLFAVASALAMFGLAVVTHAEPAKAGDPAPAFSLADPDGKIHTLAGFKGKVVVLEWNNFDCPFVARNYKNGNLPGLQKKYTGTGTIWLAVNSAAPGKQGGGTPATLKERVAKEGFAGTAYLLDPEGKAGRAYGAPVTPTMVVIDKDGVVRYWGALDDKPQGGEGAVNHVAAALDALAADKDVPVKTTKPYGCGVKY